MEGSIPQTLWKARIPVHIQHASPASLSKPPLVTSIPRFSYLALLLPRVSAYFGLPCSSFSFEQVPLRNLAVGLLADLYRPSLPWKLTVDEGVGWDIADTFLNSVKEADFIRNGNANQIMRMSKAHTTQLWHAVVDDDRAAFTAVNTRLLQAPTPLKNVPLRIYIPSTPATSATAAAEAAEPASFRVAQALVPAVDKDRRPTLFGEALHDMMPRLFPSRRDPVLAGAMMHGAQVPFAAPLAELMAEAAYPDGWLCVVVVV